MGKKDYILRFINQMFLIFGVTIIVLCLACLFIDEKIQSVSTLFDMGFNGISLETIFQILLASFFITLFNTIIFSDIIKIYISKTKRTVLLLSFIFLIIFTFIHLFKWFPTDILMTWLIFALCFVLSSFISLYIIFTNEKTDDKNMEIALKNLKEKLENEEINN